MAVMAMRPFLSLMNIEKRTREENERDSLARNARHVPCARACVATCVRSNVLFECQTICCVCLCPCILGVGK
jgi:hypothetical protein